MGWRDELLEASFGGAKFKVAGEDVEAGRLHAVHRFAGSKSRPWIEDLGPDGETFTVDAYVLGQDYLDQRRKLLDQCLRPGAAGLLTLPTWSPRYVFCTGCRIRGSSDEGGFCRFELSFQVLDTNVTIARAVRPKQDAQTNAAAVEAQAAASAEANLELEQAPDIVRDGAAESLRSIGRAIVSLDFTAGPEAVVSDVTLAARRLIDDASELATSPADLISETLAAVQGIAGAVGNLPKALEAYRVLFELEIPSLGGGSPNGQARDRNAAATISLARQAAIAGFAKTAVDVDWQTRQDAERARAQAIEAIDFEAESADDLAYGALVQLRAALTSALPPSDEDLPDLVSLKPIGDTSTLAIAYRLYDDAGRDDEIRERNNLRHPGRISAGSELEVLSR
jgi:hypothetical protein